MEKQGSGSEVKRSFDGAPTLGEEPQFTQVSSGTNFSRSLSSLMGYFSLIEYRFVVLPEVKRWGETPLCLTG